VGNPAKKTAFELLNIRLFIAFRVTFNLRFYYPVFAILFLDFGLTLEQFSLLNAVWAASIVLLEVPSGAMADVIGRRNLLVLAGALMVVEMSLLSFAPRGNLNLLFMVFLLNRVLSGAAEASASGADEAIAYDTLKKEGIEDQWPMVLERQMRIRSIASMAAMSLGAALYDPVLLGRIAAWLGLDLHLTQGITMRFPLFLTLIMALLTLFIALRMREKDSALGEECLSEKGDIKTALEAMRLTVGAGRWIIYTPFALVAILTGLLFDSFSRIVITLSSQYYRSIHLPEASFGLIASLVSIVGIFIPRFARKLAQERSPLFNLCVMSVLTLSGLTGMVFILPVIGLIPAILVYSSMFLNSFFLSHYLNRITGSGRRATVLSFKGLSFNLAYGIIGLLYSLLLAYLTGRVSVKESMSTGAGLENLVFARSLAWFPCFFILGLAIVLLFAGRRLKDHGEHRTAGGPGL